MIRKVFALIARKFLRSRLGVVMLQCMQKRWKKMDAPSSKQIRRKMNQIYPKPKSQITWNLLKARNKGLTVVIPFYNTESYARRCIESVLAQKSDFPIEVILVDDGSPDGCGDILDSYMNDSRVTVVHQENKGLSGARNTGIAISTKEYIFFLDSDDVLCPGVLDVLIKEAYEQGADIVEGGFETFGNGKTKQYAHGYKIGSGGEGMHGFAWGKVIKTDFFSDVCFPTGYWFEDTVMAAIIHPKAQISITIPDIVVKYYINNNGISQRSVANLKSIDALYITEDIIDVIISTKKVWNTQIQKGCLYQLGCYLFNRTKLLGFGVLKTEFLYAADVAEKFELLNIDYELSFFEAELVAALKNRQFMRWILAARSM